MPPSDPTLKDYVLSALNDAASVQFDFSIVDFDTPARLTTRGLSDVAGAIRSDRIIVRPFAEYKQVEDAHAAYRSVTKPPVIYIPKDFLSHAGSPSDQRTYEFGTVVHEAVHALLDMMAAQRLTHATHEAAAYLVAGLYYDARRYNIKPGFDTFTLVLLAASRLTGKAKTANATLRRTVELAELRKAVIDHYTKIIKNWRGETIKRAA